MGARRCALTRTEMDHAALIFLIDDIAAQRLAVAWPQVKGRESELTTSVETAWAHVAGVPIERVKALGPMLIANHICLADGSTNPQAMQLVRGEIASRLRKQLQGGSK